MARRRHSWLPRRGEGPHHADEAVTSESDDDELAEETVDVPHHADEAGASESEHAAAELAHARFWAGVDRPESVEEALQGAQRWIDDPDPVVREAAFRAVREIRAAAVPALMTALRSDQTEATALAGIGTAAVPALVAATLDNDERYARRAAAVLEMMPECLAAGVAELEQVLSGDDHELRLKAARALSWLRRPESARDLAPPVPVVAPRTIDSEIELLRNAHPSLCRDAVWRLGQTGPDARTAVPALIGVLFDEWLSEAAAVALGRIGGPEVAAVVPKLEPALGEGATLSRIRTALTLWHIARHPGSEPALLAALEDPDPVARSEAMDGLTALGFGSAVPAALEAIRDPDDNVRDAAARALYGSGSDDPAVVRALIGASSDPACDSPCRDALVELGAGVVPAVVEAIHEADFRHDDDLAVSLLWVLQRIGYDALAASARQAGRENVVGLVDWICSEGADEARSLFRCDAVRNDRVLGWNLLAGLEECVHSRRLRSAGEVAAVEALIAALRHPDGGVRVRAAEALSLFSFTEHSAALRAALRLALNDPDTAVRKAAEDTLWDICS